MAIVRGSLSNKGSVVDKAVEKWIDKEGSYAVFKPAKRFQRDPNGGDLIFQYGSTLGV